MVNGPPTPPPTSAIELSDAAKLAAPSEPEATAPNANPAPDAPPSRPDCYQSTLPTITDLVVQGDYISVIHACERCDLNGDGDTSSTRFLITAPLVVAYLIVDNLAPARYALSRLPDKLASQPLVKSLNDLLRATRDRKHSLVYTRAESLFKQVQQPNFLDANLGSLIASMLTAFVEAFRRRTYLGWSPEQILTAVTKEGWSYDQATQVLSPPSDSSSFSSAKRSVAGPSSLETFSVVATNVARLEV
ncbi:CSN8/PSMD8/EIF3K domain-containing protein [Pleurotus pulmonarius]